MAAFKYTELIAWQKAVDFVTAVYKVSATFPRFELYGLAGQMRRAAVSVPSNIAEGQGRNSCREFGQFLAIAYGSLSEVETQLVIAERLAYIKPPELNEILKQSAEVGRLINGLAHSIKARPGN